MYGTRGRKIINECTARVRQLGAYTIVPFFEYLLILDCLSIISKIKLVSKEPMLNEAGSLCISPTL